MTWLLLLACAYVTRDELDAALDHDGDGWPLDQDCDDTNPGIYLSAPDVRGDGCDADCADESDIDGDDWPDGADCAPNDPTIYPCSAHEVEGDGVDGDCDAKDTVRTTACPTGDPDDPTVEVNPCAAS